MKGITGSNKTEKITWSTKNKYSWSDGIRTDVYPIVNPSSYTKDGVGYSMVGFLPEMKGKERWLLFTALIITKLIVSE
jgi:hypothetical protein